MAANFLFNINSAKERINDLQSQLASGKKVQKPSDNPAATSDILRLTTALDRNQQFQKNVSDGEGALDATANSLDGVAGVLQEVQSILVSVNNGTAGDTLPAQGDRIDELMNEAIGLANTQFNGKYLFSGTATTTQPFSIAANPTPPPSQTVTYAGNGAPITYMIGEGITQQVNIDGQTAFQGTAIFNELIQIRDTLRAGGTPTAADSNAIAGMLNNVLLANSKAGSMMQILDNTGSNLTEQYNQLLSLRSGQQDTDVAGATLQLTQNQTMLSAALSVAAKVLPQSLVNFLS